MSEWRWFMRIYSCDGKAENLQEVTFISNWKNRLESWIFTWLTVSVWYILVFFICFEYINYNTLQTDLWPFFNLLKQSPVILKKKKVSYKSFWHLRDHFWPYMWDLQTYLMWTKKANFWKVSWCCFFLHSLKISGL